MCGTWHTLGFVVVLTLWVKSHIATVFVEPTTYRRQILMTQNKDQIAIMTDFIHIYVAVRVHNKYIWPSQERFPKVQCRSEGWMGVTLQNGGKDVLRRAVMCIQRHVNERSKYNALVLTEVVILATRWTVFLCLHEGRHGHMTCSCQWTVSRQVCAIPQEKPQSQYVICHAFFSWSVHLLPLLIHTGPTGWQQSMSLCAFKRLTFGGCYHILNDKESRCSWQRDSKGEHGVR